MNLNCWMMVRRSAIGLLFFLGFFVSLSSLAQVTYTSNGVGGWVRNPSTGGCSSTLNHPSQNPIAGTALCQIILIVNHPTNFTTLELGNNVKIQVGSGGKLNVSQNLIISSEAKVEIKTINDGEINVSGTLLINSGSKNKDEDLNRTILSITGDNTSDVNVGLIDLRGESVIKILDGAGLISEGPTNYNGNSSRIDVWGFFRTSKVDIQGGSSHQLNSFGDAEIIVEGDIVLGGTSDITFNGNSQVDIGGDIVNSGAAKIIANDNAKVHYCGIIKTPTNAEEKDNGKFLNQCRILQVSYYYIKSEFLPNRNASKINFATIKEWENSHFEIERSVEAGQNFQRIGTLQGAGWKDSITEYEFVDENLPLSGGDIFYRIRQVDFNGQSSVSKVLGVQIPKIPTTTGAWRAYPNPSISGSTITLALIDKSGYAEGKIQITVSDFRGITQTYTVSKPEEVSAVLNSHLENARPGMYITQVFWGSKSEQIKLIRK